MSQITEQSKNLVLKEIHKRNEEALVSFCETVVKYHPTFEERKNLVYKVGNYRNQGIHASVISSNGLICAYDTVWVEDDKRFIFEIWFWCFEKDLDQAS